MSATIGEKLKFFRIRKGMSQLQLEVDIDAAPGSISRIESGAVNPTKETVLKIAKVLEINDRQLRYIIGSHAKPATREEIEKMRQETKEFMEQKGRLAYIIDERYRMWHVSKTFLKIFNTQNDFNYEGLSLINLVLENDSPIYNYFQAIDLEKLLPNLLWRFHQEMSFMIDEPFYNQVVSTIENHPIGKTVWPEVLTKPARDVFPLEARKVTLRFNSIPVELEYSAEALTSNERFSVVEYTPSNQLLRIFSYLF